MCKQTISTSEWEYSGFSGPEHWAELCTNFAEAAAFHWQSPIALDSEGTKLRSHSLLFNYHRQSFIEKILNKTIHFVPTDTRSYLDFQGIRYWLTDIHFHVPAEHVINGSQEDIEFHLVHHNAHGEGLVVGILYRLTDAGWQHEMMENEGWDEEEKECWFDPAVWLPEVKSFYTYTGSLTTPPTVGPITWLVMDQVKPIAPTWFDQYLGRFSNPGNRPLQPLNTRVITYDKGEQSTE